MYDGGITTVLGSLLQDDERPKSSVFTTYRDDDSDFEDEPQDEPNKEDFDMAGTRAGSGHVGSRANSELTVVKSEPLSQGSVVSFDTWHVFTNYMKLRRWSQTNNHTFPDVQLFSTVSQLRREYRLLPPSQHPPSECLQVGSTPLLALHRCHRFCTSHEQWAHPTLNFH